MTRVVVYQGRKGTGYSGGEAGVIVFVSALIVFSAGYTARWIQDFRKRNRDILPH